MEALRKPSGKAIQYYFMSENTGTLINRVHH
jgi:hypothetical protein